MTVQYTPEIAVVDGLTGLLPAPQPADPNTARTILEFVPQTEELQQLVAFGDPPHGYFRAKGTGGAPDLFLKVVSRERARILARADAFATWVAEYGVPVLRLADGFPRQIGEDHILLAYRWVSRLRTAPTHADMASLGTLLATLHEAFQQHPEANSVRLETDRRLDALSEILADVRQESIPLGAIEDYGTLSWLRDLADVTPDAMDSSTFGSRQALHGDLNVGNLFKVRTHPKSSQWLFLDFEDVWWSCYPVEVELAYVLERHVLLGFQDDRVAFDMAHGLLGAYRQRQGAQLFQGQHDFFYWLRWLALRSCLIMLLGSVNRRAWPNKEWAKMRRLVAAANDRTDLLRQVSGLGA